MNVSKFIGWHFYSIGNILNIHDYTWKTENAKRKLFHGDEKIQ